MSLFTSLKCDSARHELGKTSGVEEASNVCISGDNKTVDEPNYTSVTLSKAGIDEKETADNREMKCNGIDVGTATTNKEPLMKTFPDDKTEAEYKATMEAAEHSATTTESKRQSEETPVKLEEDLTDTKAINEELVKQQVECEPLQDKRNKLEEAAQRSTLGLDSKDGIIEQFRERIHEQQDEIEKLVARNVQLDKELQHCERDVQKQRERRKCVHDDLCTALDKVDRLRSSRDQLYDKIQMLQMENRELQQQKRVLQMKLEKPEPRLECNLLLPTSCHQEDGSLLPLLLGLCEELKGKGDRVSVCIKDAPHISSADGLMLIVTRAEQLAAFHEKLHNVNTDVPFLVLILHQSSETTSRQYMDNKPRLSNVPYQCIDIMDVTVQDGRLCNVLTPDSSAAVQNGCLDDVTAKRPFPQCIREVLSCHVTSHGRAPSFGESVLRGWQEVSPQVFLALAVIGIATVLRIIIG